MKKIYILPFLILSCLLAIQPQKSAAQNTVTEDTLMARFLGAVQSPDAKVIEKFIKTNYSDGFQKGIPIQVHENIINKLHKDFAHYVIVSTSKNNNSITTVIKSPFNKVKQVTIHVNNEHADKIEFIDVKDL